MKAEGDPITAAASISLESMVREAARTERFPDGECALCGSLYQVDISSVVSNRITEPVNLYLCRECRDTMGGGTVEEYFRRSRDMNTYSWSKIISHNFRKLNWISKLAFDIFNESKEIDA